MSRQNASAWVFAPAEGRTRRSCAKAGVCGHRCWCTRLFLDNILSGWKERRRRDEYQAPLLAVSGSAVGGEARITTSGTMGVGEGRAVDVGREEETGTRRVQGGKRRGDGCEERGQRELEVCGGRRGNCAACGKARARDVRRRERWCATARPGRDERRVAYAGHVEGPGRGWGCVTIPLLD